MIKTVDRRHPSVSWYVCWLQDNSFTGGLLWRSRAAVFLRLFVGVHSNKPCQSACCDKLHPVTFQSEEELRRPDIFYGLERQLAGYCCWYCSCM